MSSLRSSCTRCAVWRCSGTSSSWTRRFRGFCIITNGWTASDTRWGSRDRRFPEFARVIAVADAFDSMTSTRSYRNARTVEEAIEEIEALQGQPVRSRDGGCARQGADEGTVAALPAASRRSVQGGEGIVEAFDHDDPSFPRSASRVERLITMVRRLDDERGAILVVVAFRACLCCRPSSFCAGSAGSQSWLAFVFGCFIAVGEVIRIAVPRRPGGSSPGAAAALAYALLGNCPGGADTATRPGTWSR